MRTAAELREAPDLLDLAGYEQGAMATTLARRRPRGEDPREARNGATKVVLHSSWCSSGEVSWRRDEVAQGRARCPGGGARRRMRGSRWSGCGTRGRGREEGSGLGLEKLVGCGDEVGWRWEEAKLQ